MKGRGFWSEELYGALFRADPDFLEAHVNFAVAQKKKGVLSEKVREFIYIAIDASTTHLHELGTTQHIRNALDLGATKEELVELFELLTEQGMDSVIMGMPILEQELKKFTEDAKE